ncbi:MAG: Rpn family recombination-promoting nuclease/putative transposase [Desulfovermiculus sp.]
MASKGEYAPHEGLFHKVFRNPDNTKYFLQQHLSPDIQRSIDLDSLRLENVSYVDDNLKKHFADLVFSLMLRGEEFPSARVYLLFEHKSAPAPLVGMQILRYMALQWKDLYDQKLIVGKLPPILPIVIYQGQDRWKPRISFHDLVEMPSDSFKAYIPDFAFAFFSVRGLDAQKVQENVILRFYVEMIKSLDSPQIKEMLPRLVQGFVQALGSHTATEYIEIFFKYLTKASGVLEKHDFQRALSYLPEGGERVMNTLADQWMEQGERNGLTKGRKQEAQDNLIAVAQEKFGALHPEVIKQIRSIEIHETLQGLLIQAVRLNNAQEFYREVEGVSQKLQ